MPRHGFSQLQCLAGWCRLVVRVPIPLATPSHGATPAPHKGATRHPPACSPPGDREHGRAVPPLVRGAGALPLQRAGRQRGPARAVPPAVVSTWCSERWRPGRTPTTRRTSGWHQWLVVAADTRMPCSACWQPMEPAVPGQRGGQVCWAACHVPFAFHPAALQGPALHGTNIRAAAAPVAARP